MVLRFTHLFGILLAALSIAAPRALAQGDPAEITRHAVAAMHRTAEATIDNIQAAATHGVAVIQRLDANGADDEEIIAAARRSVRAVHQAAWQGHRQVQMIAAHAFDLLRAANADPRFFQAVRQSAGESLDAIEQAAQRGTHAVQVALREALDG